MRKKYVIANFKMNKVDSEIDGYLSTLLPLISNANCEVGLAVPSVSIKTTVQRVKGSNIIVAGQNLNENNFGAYTGEINAEMIADVGAGACIVGHSERRKYFNETNQDVAEKVNKLLEADINPIVCVGESLEQREAGTHFELIRSQVSEGLFHLDCEQIKRTVIAYEPVWAIGTGKTATKEQAQEVHAFIRAMLAEKYSDDVAQEVSILYGRSCNAKNARELFAQTDVDGGLIGGASLKAADFIEIARSF